MPDQETLKGQLTLLNTLRQRLRIQLDQQGKMGVYAPAYLQLEIDDARAQIAKIKAYLRRYGYIVENNLEDGDEPAAAVEAPMSSIPGTPPAAEPAADVFVSYHPADKAWVRGELLPRLDRAGLRYLVDYRDFAIGAPKIVNIENAVAGSRHTLIVVTPDWLASDWNSFQGLLASSADPAGVERKLLPLILKPARLPARIAYLEAIDLTDEHERAFQMDRLIRGLTVKAPEPASSSPAPSSPAPSSPSTVPGIAAPSAAPPPVPPPPNSTVTAASLKGQIDFAIISIREDEYTAVLRRFPPQRFTEGERVYSIHELTQNDKTYRIATLRLTKQGHNEAQHATHDMIEDLDPKLFMLVGIAGGVPAREFTLGDVVVATSLTDFSVQAASEGGKIGYAATGAGIHPRLQAYLAQLPALTSTLRGWNTKQKVGSTRPPVDLDDKNFYGDEDWQKRVKQSLQYHFGVASKARNPTVVTGSIATSNQLIKDAQLLATWQQFARQTQAVEMEVGGVYEAARRSRREYPVLAIRGISDIVGFRRDDRWTEYACHSAAAFAVAFIRSGFLDRMIDR